MDLCDLYASAASTVAATAHQLTADGTTSEATAHSLQTTLHTLEQLIQAESSPGTVAGLHEIAQSLRTAGTITSDRALQIAEVLSRVATNYGELAAQFNSLW